MPESLWRSRDFLTLWSAQTLSEIGSRITREGVPLTAVLVLKAGPREMGILAALTGVAALVAGPVAGRLVDRVRRRPVLISADLGRALVLGLIPLLAIYGHLEIWHLYGIIFAAGVLTLAFDVAYQAYLPSLVSGDQLLEGNRKLAISTATAEIIGPALTGVLIQWLTAPRAILLDAISFVVSALLIGAMVHREAGPRISAVSSEAAESFLEGWRFVRTNGVLLALWLRAATFSFFAGFFFTLYVLFAVQYLKLNTVQLGIVVALGGIGNLCGALVSERLSKTWPLGRILIVSSVAPATLFFLVPLAHGTPTMGAIYLGVSQLFGDIWWPVYGIHELTLRQKITPDAMLGRVNAAMQMAMRGVYPAGALVGGFVAGATSVRMALYIAATGCLLSSLWLVFSPVARLSREPQHP
jgi:predicted MFS family arabinose efflux permease